MNNHDKLKQLTSEEFAEWLVDFLHGYVLKPGSASEARTHLIYGSLSDWLKMEYQE